MKAWVPMMAAGLVALAGGLAALINPAFFGTAATVLAGWALLIVALLLGWHVWKASGMKSRVGAGVMGLAALFLGLSLLFGPFGDGGLLRLLLGVLLIASGGAKFWVGNQEMRRAQNFQVLLGTGAVSIMLGTVVLIGLSLNFGTLLGIELLASGLALVLLAMQRTAAD
jgi:uncharacterized membrane protein HdeD (DUF308 family)